MSAPITVRIMVPACPPHEEGYTATVILEGGHDAALCIAADHPRTEWTIGRRRDTLREYFRLHKHMGYDAEIIRCTGELAA
ncbi:MAG: hypothetical protein JO212_02090 [Acetobacteraceae bacterium]|nr:hypothetical protein [Acetobacteraceae bacterium]